MLPGKKYTPEEVLRILWRRFWLIAVPLAMVAAVTAVGARKLPDWYRSEALILVVPQRVPESYVRSTVTTRIEDRLQAITQQIMSRTRLERVIQDFNLYADERQDGIMEDIVERMRTTHINVQVVKGDAFRISYIGEDPRTVMKVTDRLASLFIEESLRDREVLAENTNQFLEAQLEDARRRLIESEKRVEAYRKQHAGELPSQLQSNLQVIQNTQMQIQATVESLNRDRDERLAIERQLADLEAQDAESASEPVALPAGGDAPPPVGTALQQLDGARAALAQLEMRLKPEHPDVQRVKRAIRDLEKQAEAEALAGPVSAPARPASPADAARERRLSELRGRLEQFDRQIAAKLTLEKQLRGAIVGYQQRVDVVPTRESEMAELTREYTTLQTQFTALFTKKEESKISANLERRQIGEQFKLLDPARMPEKPFSPNRPQINLFGIAAGLALGVGLVALLEYRESTFKTDDEVTGLLTLPVLAVVPLMQSRQERRASLRNRILLSIGLGSTVAACCAVVVYTFLR